MRITASMLSLIAGKPVNANMRSIVAGLDAFGASAGLAQPHRLAQYLPQLGHESMGFHYDREVWGPTAAQKRYDTRTDLGNTPEADGDGKLYAGRTALQLTGKSNYQQFTDWCRAQGFDNPDFVAQPELVNTDPWEGLVPIWYWSTRNLNKLADSNNIEAITKRINGGLNGYADRLRWYTRCSLVLLGYPPNEIRGFQTDAKQQGFYKGEIDGDDGPLTRSSLHMMLAAASKKNTEVKAAPIEAVVPVAPQGADKSAMVRVSAIVAAVSPAAGMFGGFDQTGKLILLGIGIAAVVVMLWKGELIAARVRSIIKSFGE